MYGRNMQNWMGWRNRGRQWQHNKRSKQPKKGKKRRQAKCGHVQKSIGPFAGPSLFWASVAADPLARSLANAQHVLHIGACRHKSILGRRLFFLFFFVIPGLCKRRVYRMPAEWSARRSGKVKWRGRESCYKLDDETTRRNKSRKDGNVLLDGR